MTTKTVSKSKPRAAKARTRKTAPKAAASRKAPAASVFDQFGDTVIALPFKAANKTFMASLGLLSYMQNEIEKQYREFDRKFEMYAKDGEKVFGRFEHRVEDFRKDVEKRVEEVRGRVRGTFDKAA